MKPIIVIVNGYPRSGKDTFVENCRAIASNKGYRSRNISSVDNVKKAALLLGWDGNKDSKGRKFLSDLKGLSTFVYDGPMQYMEEYITSCEGVDPCILFFHIREPDEIAKMVAKHPEALTVIIHRGESEMNHENAGDLYVLRYHYDIQVWNDGDLFDLYEVSKHTMEVICK